MSNLSSEAFIAAFRRFIARRGIPNEMMSDNGINFKAASSTLHELYTLFNSEDFKTKIHSFSSS